jgi:PAS domain-containing protein
MTQRTTTTTTGPAGAPPGQGTSAPSPCADFQALFHAAPTPLLVVAPPDFTIIAVNDAYLRVTMTEREAILGRGLHQTNLLPVLLRR